jgi:hypothetical protein
MECEEGDVELAGAEGLDQSVVGVELADPVAAFAQGLRDPLARAERHLPLERQAAGDDRHRAVEGHGAPAPPAGRQGSSMWKFTMLRPSRPGPAHNPSGRGRAGAAVGKGTEVRPN